jgi:hypothetical protein
LARNGFVFSGLEGGEMKLPEKPTEVEIYVNEIVYKDKFGSTRTYRPPKWLELALDCFWERAYAQGRKSVKNAPKEFING